MTEGNDLNRVENHLVDSEKRWFAIYTKFKCEKYVVAKLQKKDVEAYIPLLSKTKVYASKKKHYQLPLINCYVFVKIDKSQYIKVLETEHVSGFLKQRKNLISIPDYEINLLKKIVGEFEDVDLSKEDYKVGSKVEIISGNLTGIQGILIKRQGKNEFVVELENIGLALNMTIDVSMLRPLDTRLTA